MKYIFFFGLVFSMIAYLTVKANAGQEDYEVSLKVYTSTEIHQMLPEIEDVGKNIHYVLGSIKIKGGVNKDPKKMGRPIILIWLNSYNAEVRPLAVGYQKSYFLVPFGYVYVSGNYNLKYEIKY